LIVIPKSFGDPVCQIKDKAMRERHHLVTEDLDRILAQPLPWEDFSGQVVLISGASGLLPGSCAEVLLRLNESNRLVKPVKVVAFSRSKEALSRRFAVYSGRSDLIMIAGDTRYDKPEIEPIDYILHGASPASPATMSIDILATFEANVIGTKNLLDLAKERRTRKFLFMSSGAVYGIITKNIQSISETDFGPLDPLVLRSAYEEGKRAGETLCKLYAEKYGLSTVIARIAHTYGPGLRPDDNRSFAEFISAAAERRPLILNSDGSAIRYFCYVSDTIAGLFTILLLGSVGEAYNVGSETEGISIIDLVRLIIALFPERRLELVQADPTRHADSRALISSQKPLPPNTYKLRSLGWQDKVKLTEGLRRSVLAYENASN
jgi:dTDP-glucose 4,6-dehydratase